MPKPAVVKVHPQTILRGNTVRSRESKTDEIVRSVSIVVHLANGMDEVYDDTDEVQLVPNPTPAPDFPKELADSNPTITS